MDNISLQLKKNAVYKKTKYFEVKCAILQFCTDFKTTTEIREYIDLVFDDIKIDRVSYILSSLVNAELLRKVSNLNDCRSYRYKTLVVNT